MSGIGVYTNLIKEIKARLDAYTLLDAFIINVGTKNVRKQSGDKYMQIEYGSPFIEEDYMRVRKDQKEGRVNLLIWVTFPKIRDAANGMFATDTTGVIPTMEDILDALNTDTSSELNPQITNAAKSMEFSIGSVLEHDSTTEFEIEIKITTTDFVINDRGNN